MASIAGIAVEGIVELVTVDLTSFEGGSVYYFINAPNPASIADDPTQRTITWQGQTYQPLPFASSGFQRGERNDAKPEVVIPDFTGALYLALEQYEGAPGAPVVRRQALAADILSNNPNAVVSEDRYVINKVTYESGTALKLELATPIDFAKRKIPAFVMTRKHYPGLGSAIKR